MPDGHEVGPAPGRRAAISAAQSTVPKQATQGHGLGSARTQSAISGRRLAVTGRGGGRDPGRDPPRDGERAIRDGEKSFLGT